MAYAADYGTLVPYRPNNDIAIYYSEILANYIIGSSKVTNSSF